MVKVVSSCARWTVHGGAFALLLLIWAMRPGPVHAVPGIDGRDLLQSAPGMDDKTENVEELLDQANALLRGGRPIDARAKLQKAQVLAPQDYRPLVKLGYYYLAEVGHFKLAYVYLRNAEKYFNKQYPAADDIPPEASMDHALLLHLIAEAELNLDKYEDSLKTLDRFERQYWMEWYPGTRAWVLMKLKRIDEAIRIAQAGLLRGGDPRQTWNILGILLSVKDNREMSLEAFGHSIRSELLLGGGEIATPLNNAGEVYREMFQDDIAEASWLYALQLPDGCEHILPSLNLAIMYVDQLRLFQGERVLADFENCFAQRSLREDTEHRTLLALGRGRIALHKNEIDKAVELLNTASEEQQWFGKIGTNENDVRLAATIAMSQALSAKAAALRDTVHGSWWEAARDAAAVPVLRIRAWWLNRTARKIALEELDDFEDLNIRNTDTMLEYPTLGTLLAGFNRRALDKRLGRMNGIDNRPGAKMYYRLYQAANYVSSGKTDAALGILSQTVGQWRKIDRLAMAENIRLLYQAHRQKSGWFKTRQEESDLFRLKEQLYAILPSHVRYYGLSLPVEVQATAVGGPAQRAARKVTDSLTSRRFTAVKITEYQPQYKLLIACREINAASGEIGASASLIERSTGRQQVLHSASLDGSKEKTAEFINNFIAKAFGHQVDPIREPLPRVPILEGLYQQ